MQNGLESAGMATVSLSMNPQITLGTGVPRALYARFPYGSPYGEPGNAERQRTVLETALRWIYEAPEPNQMFRLMVSWRRSSKVAQHS
jgi:D-proline reductase (dithiol) PrdB